MQEPSEPQPPNLRLGPPPAGRLMRLALRFYAGMAVLAVLWRVGLAGEPIFYASEAAARRGADPLWDVALGALAAALVVLVSWQLTEHTRFGRALGAALARALGPLRFSQCVVLALASGIGEELLFRGALQPRVGLVAASLIFGLVHFVPKREFLPWTVFSIAAGFLLGILFENTGNLLAPVVAHVGINAVNLNLLSRQFASGDDGDGIDFDAGPER